MITFRDKEYNSKADIVRAMFDSGEVTMDSESKKRVAKELGMTVQTVHATLVKYRVSVVKITKPTEPNNIVVRPAETQIKKQIVNKISKPILFCNENDTNTAHRFEVIYAPNPWGLPICRPPLVVVDADFTPETLNKWYPKPDDAIERSW